MRRSLNFLAAWRALEVERRKAAYRVLLGLLFALLVLVVVQGYVAGLFALIFLLVFIVCLSFKLDYGLYVLSAVAFFTGWTVSVSSASLDRVFNLPFTFFIKAPIGDMVALVLIAAAVVAYIFAWKREEWQNFVPAGRWYALFLIAALVSAKFAYNHEMAASVKYVLRPLLFSYVAFLVLPAALIRTKIVFYRVAAIWFGVASVIALFGLTSLGQAESGWTRVKPYVVAGIAPLGVNHNQLAEPLVALAPLLLWLVLWSRGRTPNTARFFKWTLGVVLIVAALTLSRAAWLALAAEAAIFIFLNKSMALEWWRSIRERSLLVGALAVLIMGYMGMFLTSSIAATSNLSRSTMLEISYTYFKYSPWIGLGPGKFYQLMGETRYFIMEYGEPLDAHGFIQKVLVEEGVVGMILFGIFLFVLLRRFARAAVLFGPTHFYLAPCLLMMSVGGVVFQLFNTGYFASTMWMPFGVALAGIRLLEQKELL